MEKKKKRKQLVNKTMCWVIQNSYELLWYGFDRQLVLLLDVLHQDLQSIFVRLP